MGKKQFNGMDFIRKVYLLSEPSVDFDSAERIDCTKHKLKLEIYEPLLEEFCGDDMDLICSCNMFMLNQGPQLY